MVLVLRSAMVVFGPQQERGGWLPKNWAGRGRRNGRHDTTSRIRAKHTTALLGCAAPQRPPQRPNQRPGLTRRDEAVTWTAESTTAG